MPKVTILEPTAAHERFYADVAASSLRHGLQDREMIALLALMIGRMCGIAAINGTEEDRATLVDTAVHNLKFGRESAAALLDALGKGH
jgi:hypothetical protein